MKCLLCTVGIFCAGIVLFSAGTTSAQDLVIKDYTLISKKRVDRTSYDYTYQAEITNTGADVQKVIATLTINSPHTVVIDGSISFGDISSGSTVTSSDAFTICQDRRYPFDLSALVWNISFESTDWPDDEVKFDVEWDPNTTLIEKDDLSVVKSADPENDTYTFDAAAVQSKGLDLSAGRILVIHQIALAEIIDVQQSGTDLIVTTGPAALTNAIKNGTISWDVGISFAPDKIQEIDDNQTAKRAASGDPMVIEKSFAYGGYNYTTKITLANTYATIDFITEKKLANDTGARLTTKGTIQRFRCIDTISITDNTLQTFDHDYEKLKGELTLTLAAAASGNVNHMFTKPLFTFVIPMPPSCPIRLELEIGAVFLIRAVLPATGSAKVTAKFSYDSDLGVSFDGTESTASADFEDTAIDDQDKEHHVAGSSQVGFNYGIGFPHIELKGSFIHEKLASAAAWAHPAFLIGGSFTVGGQAIIPSCVKVDAEFIGAAGLNVSALAGFFSADKNFDLFKHKENLLTAGDCPDP